MNKAEIALIPPTRRRSQAFHAAKAIVRALRGRGFNVAVVLEGLSYVIAIASVHIAADRTVVVQPIGVVLVRHRGAFRLHLVSSQDLVRAIVEETTESVVIKESAGVPVRVDNLNEAWNP